VLSGVAVEIVDRLVHAPSVYGTMVLCRAIALDWPTAHVVIRGRPGRSNAAELEEAREEYAKLSPAIIEKFGGRFLARGGRSTTLEGPPAPGRVVVIEFPSYERAQAFYNSPEYVAARKVRAGAAKAQFVLVEGQ